MTILKIALGLATAIIIISAVYLLYENRADFKILSKAILPILIGALAAITTIFFQSDSQVDKDKFQYLYITDMTNVEEKFPLGHSPNIGYGEPSFMILRRIKQDSTIKALELKAAPMEQIIYFRILEIYSTLFSDSWSKTIETYDNKPGGRVTTYKVNDVKKDTLFYSDFQIKSDGVLFDHYFNQMKSDFKILVPKGTRVSYSKSEGLIFSNKYIDHIKVKVEEIPGGWVDNGGYLRLMYSEQDREDWKNDFKNKMYSYITYSINFEVKENPLFKGNPELPTFREWITNLKKTLELEFDNTKQFRVLIERFNKS
ncbi:MAG: hypothetical protein AB3N14_05245 [Flavobacteriaceae bacterium]